jgi:putative transcriptional regulator
MLLNKAAGRTSLYAAPDQQPTFAGEFRGAARGDMPADRHPSQEARAAYKAGDISPGTALALTLHAERCAVCRVDIQSLFRPARGGRSAARRPVADDPIGNAASPALGALRQSPWRWLGPGVKVAEIYGASGLGEAVHLLKLAPGRAMPPRAVAALAQAVVLEGGLRDGAEAFGPGDYIDVETQPLRRPLAERPGGCLCLVVTDGSWPRRGLGGLLSPLRGRKGG